MLEVLGISLVHSLWQGGLVAAGLWLVLRLAGPSAVRVRYAASLLALVALLALPVLNYRATMELWSGHRSWVLATADGILRSELETRGRAEVGAVREELRRRQAAEWPVAAPMAGNAATREGARALGLLWLMAAGFLAFRLAAEQRRAMALAESGVPHEGWRASAARVAGRLDLGHGVRVRVTDRVDVPALVGWRWPVVLVPTAAAELAEAERDAVLAHELAHIRRRDYAVNLLQSVAEVLLFYSPAAWWVSASIREERECCCDQAAVGAVQGGPARYVHALLALETGRAPRRATPRSAMALTGGPLLRRIRRIHALARTRPAARPGAALAALLLAGCITVGVGALTPDLAARRSAGVLMAGDIEAVRLMIVRAPAAPSPTASPDRSTCGTRTITIRV